MLNNINTHTADRSKSFYTCVPTDGRQTTGQFAVLDLGLFLLLGPTCKVIPSNHLVW